MKRIISLLVISVLAANLNIYSQVKQSQFGDSLVLYVVRHGKTIFNTLDRVQGWADTPLTKEGVRVAEQLGTGLKQERAKFKAAYSSDLGRAMQTAEIVLNNSGQGNLSISQYQSLREVCFGSYEGDLNKKMWADIALYLHFKNMKEMLKAYSPSRTDTLLIKSLSSIKELDTLGIAEDFQAVKTRSQYMLKEIAEKEIKSGSGNVLIVSHGMTINILLSDLDDSKKVGMQNLKNASVCKIIYKNSKFRIVSVNDISYLDKGKGQ